MQNNLGIVVITVTVGKYNVHLFTLQIPLKLTISRCIARRVGAYVIQSCLRGASNSGGGHNRELEGGAYLIYSKILAGYQIATLFVCTLIN